MVLIQNKFLLERLPSEYFDWSCWRAGSVHELVLACRMPLLLEASHILRQYAVGWCKGESLLCRPKVDHIALMFFKDGRHFWFHLRKQEFEEIFYAS